MAIYHVVIYVQSSAAVRGPALDELRISAHGMRARRWRAAVERPGIVGKAQDPCVALTSAYRVIGSGAMKELDGRVYAGLAAFRLALRRFLAFSETITASEGATSQQYQALLALMAHVGGPMTVGEFAEQMLLQPHGAVQMIDRLVAGGWVERKHSPKDGRSVLVSLTPEGANVLRRLAAAHVVELLAQEPLLAESLRRLRKIGKDSLT